MNNDSVFQISLTELAFTLVLLMLLLLGWRLADIYDERNALHDNLLKFQEIQSRLGGICKPDPEDPIEPMMPCIKCVSEVGKMSKDEARYSIEFGKELVEQFKANNKTNKSLDAFQEEMILVAQKLAEGHNLVTDVEQQKILDEATAAIAARRVLEQENQLLKEAQVQLQTDNKSLRIQKGYLQRVARTGEPSCWITAETYKPQYLLDIVIEEDSSYSVRPYWPKEREQTALAIPGVKQMIAKKNLTRSEFNFYAKQIYDFSRAQKPDACRFFVRMKSKIPNRSIADTARLNLENYFYKLEILEKN